MKKKHLLVFIVTYIVLVIFGIAVSFFASYYLKYNSRDAIKLYPQVFTDGEEDMSYRMLKHHESKMRTYTTDIPKSMFDSIGSSDYTIVIYRLQSQGYRVYFNNINIGSVGDIKKGRSNIWNTMSSFSIDKDLVHDNNRLTIETYSVYNTGLTNCPILITDAGKANNIFGYFNLIIDDMNAIAVGFAFCSFTVVLLLYILTGRDFYLYFALGMLSISAYTFDYLIINNLPFSYLHYKKLIIFSLYFAVFNISMAIYRCLQTKINMVLAIVTMVGICIIIILSPNMITFKNIYNYYNILIPINVLCWLYSTIKNIKTSDEAKFFFVGTIFLLVFAVYNIYVTIYSQHYVLNTPFFYVSVSSILPLFLVFLDFTNKSKQIELESRKKADAYKRAIIDGMTGLYNHQYMISILPQLAFPYALVMLDVDDFKVINDTYGHRIGDLVIQHIASLLKEKIRGTDLFFRYGGDEFSIVLFDCTAENAKRVIEDILFNIEGLPLDSAGNKVKMTLSAGIYYVATREDIDHIIDKADQALYCSKNNGKNMVTLFGV